MQREPGQPRHHPGHFQPAHLRHGLGAPDGGHGALVPILERFTRHGHAGKFVVDDPCHVTRHLHGRRRHAGHRLAVGLHDQRQITNGKHFRMARHTQVWIHFHPAGTVQFHAQFPGQRRGRNAGRPQDVPGPENLTVRQFHFPLADVFHLHPGAHMHTQPFQLARRTERKILRQVRQDARPALHQNDIRLGWINMAEVVPQNMARQFGKGPRQLHPGGPATNDDDRHQPDVLRIGLRVFRLFKRQQHPAANAHGITQRLEAGRELLPFRVAEIIGPTAQRHHQVIVCQRLGTQNHLAFCQVHIRHFIQENRHLFAFGEDGPDGLRDFGRG